MSKEIEGYERRSDKYYDMDYENSIAGARILLQPLLYFPKTYKRVTKSFNNILEVQFSELMYYAEGYTAARRLLQDWQLPYNDTIRLIQSFIHDLFSENIDFAAEENIDNKMMVDRMMVANEATKKGYDCIKYLYYSAIDLTDYKFKSYKDMGRVILKNIVSPEEYAEITKSPIEDTEVEIIDE